MNRQIGIVVALIGLMMGGCTLAPKYARPGIPVPEKWPQGAAYPEAASPPGSSGAAPGWTAFFNHPPLQTIIQIALENNRDLRLAALNVEKVRALYHIQRAEHLPGVNGVGSMSRQRIPADLSYTGELAKPEQYGANASIAAWEIDFFGRIRSLSDQALETYLATDQARQSAQITLIAEVARAYLTLAADREALALARATLETQQASDDLIRKSYDIGLATEIDVHRSKTQVDMAQRDVPRFLQQTAQDQNALDLLTGTPVAEDLLPRDLDSIADFKAVSAGLPSDVLLSRPDILAAEHRLKGAYAFIGAARAAFFPQIFLTGSMGTASAELSGLFKAGSGTWSFTPEITFPIFDARTWAAYRVSKVDREILLTQYEKTIQTAFREVADALAVQGTIDRQLAAQKNLVASVAETYRLSNKRYEMGIDSYLSVLDAQRSLYAQKQVLISLRLARLSNQVALYAVLGGGAPDPSNGEK